MAAYTKTTPEGWEQGDDTVAISRLTPEGWVQIAAAAGGGISTALEESGYSILEPQTSPMTVSVW